MPGNLREKNYSEPPSVIFIILTQQFKSHMQPFMIMAIIPFGWFDMPITMSSGFGFVALSGIIINDSILMIDFINRRVWEGADVYETLIGVGQERFRPIFLTSVTTFGGLLPIVVETSLQAKIMIPMALSLAGGVFFALFFVLFFVPVVYSYYADGLAWLRIERNESTCNL